MSILTLEGLVVLTPGLKKTVKLNLRSKKFEGPS